MSIFIKGYFKVLPRELRDELFEYVFESLSSVITLDASNTREWLDQELSEDNISFELTKGTTLFFRVIIDLPEEYANEDANFPFQVQFQQLQEFLDFLGIYSADYKFISKNKLKINKSVISDANGESIGLARAGLLKNKEERNCINLEHNGSNYLAFSYWSEGGRIKIYSLTEIQSEILVYKLIQFYKDLITQDLTNIAEEY